MKARHIGVWIALFCTIFVIPSLSFALTENMQSDPFYSQSVNKDNSPVEAASEHVDPFSGNLSVVQTDIHLPGNGGLDLNITRAYNSAIWGRRDLTTPGFIQMYEASPLGIGWSMHMGILRNPRGNGSSSNWMPNNPVFELPDGSQQVFFKDKNNTTRFISKDFWTMSVSYPGVNQDVYTITASDGTVYTAEFGTAKAGYTLYDGRIVGQVTGIKNAAGTASISVTYHRQSVDNMYYINTITDSVGRQLNFNYANKLLQSITVDSRTFQYAYTTMSYSAITYSYLSRVAPPVGNPWSYTYESTTNTYQMNSISFPTGGVISYLYADRPFATGKINVNFRVVTSRTTSGRDITGGTWSYTYNSGGSSGDVTTISAPGVTETHHFYGWGNTGSNYIWKVGLPMSKDYSGNLNQSESYSWSQGTLISNDTLANGNWGNTGGQVYDSAIYVPFLSSKSITRDSKTYTTNYGSFNTYGDPQSISESGDLSRSKSVGYWTNTTKNIVKGKPSSETMSGGFSGTSSKSWSYDSNSGYPTQFNNNGIVTNYNYGSDGNLSSITDANSKQTSYQWTNGRISRETNPVYSVSRSINTNGTIASETNGRGYTTNYSYDGNLRLTGISPPAGNATSFSYPGDSSYRKEARGGYWIQHNFDGYGRPSGSSDSKGIITNIEYDAYGTKDYSDSNVGDKVDYDYFGRTKQVIHKDSSSVTYNYSGSTITISDENNSSQTLTYYAFGNPDEKYLMGVRDQDSNTTTYYRNVFGIGYPVLRRY